MQARLASQDTLNDETRSFYFVLTEQAVRVKRAPAPVMAAQFRHLIAVSDRENVDLTVLPTDALIGASPLRSFVVYDQRLVSAEMFSGSVVLRDYRDISYHRNILIHGYAAVDDALVWQVLTERLRALAAVLRRLLAAQ